MNKYIDCEIILSRKINLFIYVYIMIIIIIALSLIIFFILFNYKTYYKVKGIIVFEEDTFYIKTYIPLDNIKYLVNNNIVKIDNKNYKYTIASIDKEYFTDNKDTYQIITIKIDIEEKYKINNLTTDLYFLKESKRVIDYILERK